MNPLQSNIPQQHYTAPINTSQTVAASSAQSQPLHPAALSLASLSHNANLALDQTEAQPNGHHQLMALLARNGIADGAMQLHSTQGADAHYRQQVNVLPENDVADLTLRARSNGRAQYDIVGIDLHVPSSGRSESVALSAPPPATQQHQAVGAASADTASVSSHLASKFSRGQLTQALIRQNSPQDFSGAPLPSGDSVSTQSMVFSHNSSAGASTGVPGPSRSRTEHAAHSEPYPASSQSGASSSRGRNARVPDPEHLGQTISRNALSQRKHDRQQVPDPEHPEQTISRATLSQRKQVPDPEHPGQTISRNALNQRKYNRQQVPDPDHPGQTISRNALNQRKHDRQQVPDPEHPGQTISRNALATRQSRARAAARTANAENA